MSKIYIFQEVQGLIERWTDSYMFDFVSWKKKCNLKAESYVLFSKFSEDCKPRIQTLRLFWGTTPKRKRGVDIEGFLQQKPGGRTIKGLLLIKLMNSALFSDWEDGRVWAYWSRSFSMHLNYLGLIPCFSPSGGGGCSGCWLDGCKPFVDWCIRQEVVFIHILLLSQKTEMWSVHVLNIEK